ncbi:hypothetical protein WN943_028119 [Citrus x changshan-huyou]
MPAVSQGQSKAASPAPTSDGESFNLQDINRPRNCICSDAGGVDSHVPYSLTPVPALVDVV